MKDHLLSRVQKDISLELLGALDGLPPFLESGDISGLVDSLVKAYLSKGFNLLRASARAYLVELWRLLPSGEKDWIGSFMLALETGLNTSNSVPTRIQLS